MISYKMVLRIAFLFLFFSENSRGYRHIVDIIEESGFLQTVGECKGSGCEKLAEESVVKSGNSGQQGDSSEQDGDNGDDKSCCKVSTHKIPSEVGLQNSDKVQQQGQQGQGLYNVQQRQGVINQGLQQTKMTHSSMVGDGIKTISGTSSPGTNPFPRIGRLVDRVNKVINELIGKAPKNRRLTTENKIKDGEADYSEADYSNADHGSDVADHHSSDVADHHGSDVADHHGSDAADHHGSDAHHRHGETKKDAGSKHDHGSGGESGSDGESEGASDHQPAEDEDYNNPILDMNIIGDNHSSTSSTLAHKTKAGLVALTKLKETPKQHGKKKNLQVRKHLQKKKKKLAKKETYILKEWAGLKNVFDSELVAKGLRSPDVHQRLYVQLFLKKACKAKLKYEKYLYNYCKNEITAQEQPDTQSFMEVCLGGVGKTVDSCKKSLYDKRCTPHKEYIDALTVDEVNMDSDIDMLAKAVVVATRAYKKRISALNRNERINSITVISASQNLPGSVVGSGGSIESNRYVPDADEKVSGINDLDGAIKTVLTTSPREEELMIAAREERMQERKKIFAAAEASGGDGGKERDYDNQFDNGFTLDAADAALLGDTVLQESQALIDANNDKEMGVVNTVDPSRAEIEAWGDDADENNDNNDDRETNFLRKDRIDKKGGKDKSDGKDSTEDEKDSTEDEKDNTEDEKESFKEGDVTSQDHEKEAPIPPWQFTAGGFPNKPVLSGKTGVLKAMSLDLPVDAKVGRSSIAASSTIAGSRGSDDALISRILGSVLSVLPSSGESSSRVDEEGDITVKDDSSYNQSFDATVEKDCQDIDKTLSQIDWEEEDENYTVASVVHKAFQEEEEGGNSSTLLQKTTKIKQEDDDMQKPGQEKNSNEKVKKEKRKLSAREELANFLAEKERLSAEKHKPDALTGMRDADGNPISPYKQTKIKSLLYAQLNRDAILISQAAIKKKQSLHERKAQQIKEKRRSKENMLFIGILGFIALIIILASLCLFQDSQSNVVCIKEIIVEIFDESTFAGMLPILGRAGRGLGHFFDSFVVQNKFYGRILFYWAFVVPVWICTGWMYVRKRKKEIENLAKIQEDLHLAATPSFDYNIFETKLSLLRDLPKQFGFSNQGQLEPKDCV